jgi:hypothetical protein
MGSEAVWLERFVDPRPISAEGAFRITAARDGQSGAPVVVVTLQPEADRTRGEEALAAFFRAHRRDLHPVVARAIELGSDPRAGPSSCSTALRASISRSCSA